MTSRPDTTSSGPQTPPPRVVQCHCNKCGHPTNHEVVACHRHQANNSNGDPRQTDYMWLRDEAETLQCRGCNSFSFRESVTFSEDDPMVPTVSYYPPRVSRQLPQWASRLDGDEVRSLMNEVYTALHNGLSRLAVMGARAILDLTMNRYAGGDLGTFAKKLKFMVDGRFLTAAQSEMLEAALEAGSAAAHRGHRPTDRDLSAVMDIVESILQAPLLEEDAQRLRQSTPARPAKPPSSP